MTQILTQQVPSSQSLADPTRFYLNMPSNPKAILHYVHGMSEHAQRYQPMAEWFAQHNILFIAHDQIGHGPLAKEQHKLGNMGNKNVAPYLVDDLHNVVTKVQSQFPNLPYFLLGHSMGSFVVRLFLQTYSTSISGAILSGTLAYTPVLRMSRIIFPLLPVLLPNQRNYALHRFLFDRGDAAQNFNGSWIKRRYEEEPDWQLTGFVFTNGGFLQVANLAYLASRPGWNSPVRHDLPLLIMHGVNDPLYRHGLTQERLTYEFNKAQFFNVRFQVYEKRGHELFLYDNETIVYNDILNWITNITETTSVR